MENQKKVFDTIRKSCLLFFKFCWISHLSLINIVKWLHIFQFFNFLPLFWVFTISRFSKFVIFHFLPTLSKWLDIFRFGFGLVWLWNVQNSWDLTQPRLSYTFLFFDFPNFCQSNWNVSHIIKLTGHFYDLALSGFDYEVFKILVIWYDNWQRIGISFTFSSFWFFKFCIFMFSSGKLLSVPWLYTIGPHFLQGSNYYH